MMCWLLPLRDPSCQETKSGDQRVSLFQVTTPFRSSGCGTNLDVFESEKIEIGNGEAVLTRSIDVVTSIALFDPRKGKEKAQACDIAVFFN